MDKEPNGNGVTLYASVSVDRGHIKTSASAYVTGKDGQSVAETQSELADAMSASIAVAALARQSVVTAFEDSTLSDHAVRAFLLRVGRVVDEITEGGS